MPAFSDAYTKNGAGVLAGRIEAYWHALGYPNVEVKRYALRGFDGLWGVKSNLVAGLPPKC